MGVTRPFHSLSLVAEGIAGVWGLASGAVSCMVGWGRYWLGDSLPALNYMETVLGYGIIWIVMISYIYLEIADSWQH